VRRNSRPNYDERRYSGLVLLTSLVDNSDNPWWESSFVTSKTAV
jgi:hypothetical protein